jgi:hypothetical protein
MMKLIAWTAAAALLGVGAAAAPQKPFAAATEFDRRMEAYLELRHHATKHAPSFRVTSDFREILATEDAIAEAIRAARPTAGASEIFTAEISDAFRARIEEALERDPRDVARLLAHHAPKKPVSLAVNARFDWTSGAEMPSWLIAVLPPTPSDVLQYRLIGRDLVLLDIGASLIVDVLHDALPESQRH